MTCLRLASIDDLPGIKICSNRCFGEVYDDKVYAMLLSQPLSFVEVTGNGEIVGNVLVNGLHSDWDRIFSLCVLDTYRNRGLGDDLLKAAVSKLRSIGTKPITLHVRVSNFGAQKLYLKNGFHNDINIVAGYYPDGEDAYFMACH